MTHGFGIPLRVSPLANHAEASDTANDRTLRRVGVRDLPLSLTAGNSAATSCVEDHVDGTSQIIFVKGEAAEAIDCGPGLTRVSFDPKRRYCLTSAVRR
jgi:hypothetical protein